MFELTSLTELATQVQKLVHKSNTDGKRSYLSFPAWWLGLVLMAVSYALQPLNSPSPLPAYPSA
jgi:hypothetical protein